jgi:hypothetical protein
MLIELQSRDLDARLVARPKDLLTADYLPEATCEHHLAPGWLRYGPGSA